SVIRSELLPALDLACPLRIGRRDYGSQPGERLEVLACQRKRTEFRIDGNVDVIRLFVGATDAPGNTALGAHAHFHGTNHAVAFARLSDHLGKRRVALLL